MGSVISTSDSAPPFVSRLSTRTGRDDKLSYRGDIDGLRAIAVLSVVTYHFFPAQAKGGFVGVDIFFVISGYLISSMIFNEMESASFSFVEFYVRRIRRIYPAFFLVLGFVCAAGWLFLLPSAFVLLGKQIIGGSAFVANFVLWSQSGYFSVDATHKPLLHLWSLGVEEQFYLIFPVICLAFHRAKSRFSLPAAFLGIATVSMALNVTFVASNRDAVYFLPFSRLWELLVGAGLSLSVHRNLQDSWLGRSLSKWRTAIGFMGLVLLAFSIFKVDQFDLFPGWWALLPTMGSALVIAAGRNSWSNRYILSCRPAVFVGLISYPLYLWHWPILSFARIATNSIWGTDLSHLFKAALASLSIVVAYLTYRFVELPIRQVRQKDIRRRGALWLLGCVFTTGLFGVVVVWKGGFPARLPNAVVALDHDYEADASRAYREGTCLLRSDQVSADFGVDCLDPVQASVAKPLVIVWGDSHAADLFPGFRALNLNSGLRLAQYTAATCPPLIGLRLRWRPACMAINNSVLDRIRKLKPDVVVLSAYWEPREPGQDHATRAEELRRTIELVKSAGVPKVVVIGSAPSWTSGVPAILVDRIVHNSSEIVPQRLPRSLLEPHDDTQLKAATQDAGAIYVPLFENLCDQTSCIVSTGTSWRDILTYDKAHFTEHGSLLVAERIWSAISPSKT